MNDQRDQTRAVQTQDRRPPMTAVQQAAATRAAKMNTFLDAATANQANIERSLKHHGIEFSFFMAALEVGLRNTLKTDSGFFDVVPVQAFIEAALKACHLGLLPDGKEGAIVRFANDAAFLPMVEGFSKILWKTGAVTEINHNVVCVGDDFDFQEGDDGFVTHRRSLTRPADAEVIGAWCVVKLATGGKLIEVCDQADLKKIASVSRATKGPRVDWQKEMHRKAPFRRIMKRLPKTEALSALIAHDDTAYDLARTMTPAIEAPAAQRKALFSDRPVRRQKPAAALEAPQEPQDGVEVTVVVEDTGSALQAALEALEGAIPAGATAVAEVIHAIEEDPALQDLGADESAKLVAAMNDAGARAMEVVVAPEDDFPGDAPPRDSDFSLTAIITSTEGAVVYEDAGEWRDDILAKMSTITGPAAVGFWKANRGFIRAARDAGVPEATRVIEDGAERGLPVEDQ